MLPIVISPAVEGPVHRYLGIVDRLLPGRVSGFYLVGSVALGAFRPGRSDIDFVAVVEGDLGRADLRRLRAVHAASGLRTTAAALGRGQVTLPGTCNGVYVRAGDLDRPVSTIVPVAAHTGATFSVGRAFDVNPVQWATFATQGVAVRGPEVGTLGLDPEPGKLREWNLANLRSYWVPWAGRMERRPGPQVRAASRWWSAWGVLGAPRLHHTITTGQVISKEDAGAYARDAFGPRWHPLIDDALAHRFGQPGPPQVRGTRARIEATGAFVLAVAASVGVEV